MNDLPEVISSYFSYKNSHNKAGLLSVFAATAKVFDRGENKEIQGMDEIEIWIDTSLAGLNLQTEIEDVTKEGDLWSVSTIVSGDFKASPARFRYLVGVSDDKISSLDIAFAGTVS